MRLPEPIASMEAAEELFEGFGVAYDPAVLQVHRIRILRRFGERIAAIASREPPDGPPWAAYATELASVYEECRNGGGAVLRSPRADLVTLRIPSRRRCP